MKQIRDKSKFKILRIISFYDEGIKASGTICYTRPLSSSCYATRLSAFDDILIKCLSELNLQNVRLIQCTLINTTDKSMINGVIKAYIIGRQSSELLITYLTHLNNELIIKAVKITLYVYWNKHDITIPPMFGGTIDFDMYKDVKMLNSIKEL